MNFFFDNSYLFGLCLLVEFLFLEQTIKADISINAIRPGMAQKTILYGNSILFIQPSIKMFPELGEYLHSLSLIQQDRGAFWLSFFKSSFAVQSWNPEMKEKCEKNLFCKQTAEHICNSKAFFIYKV